MKSVKFLLPFIVLMFFTTCLSATTWVKNAAQTSASTSPSPYNNNSDITETLTIAGAVSLKVTATGITESRYDFLYITDAAGNERKFDGTIDETFSVSGSMITIHFTSDYSVTQTGVTITIENDSIPIVENADDMCYEEPISTGFMCMDMGMCKGGIGCKNTYPIRNIGNDTISDAKLIYDETGLGGSFGSSCGVSPSGTCQSSSDINMGPIGMLGKATEYNITNPIPADDGNTSIWAENFMSGSCFNGENLYGSYIKNGVMHRGKVSKCKQGYCKSHNLPEGFNIIDPDEGDDDNSYEVYCDNSTYTGRELIALPLKNDYNNFVFKNDSPQANYYTAADEAKADDPNNEFSFLQIKIAEDHSISVVPSSIANNSTHNQGYFSNINLIATPFAIDWSETNLTNCNESKLRKGADDQAVKINTLDYTKGRCKVESMKLKLLSDYKYLKWADINNGEEVLKETCRQIFETVPDAQGYLPTGSSNGHYWIDPDQGGRGNNDSVMTLFRPIVATCQYQEDIGEAWTFIMALDGKVTNSKNDIRTMDEVRANPTIKHDSCSQLGLLFYVPNIKDTFERVRKYLKNEKLQWFNYTGTIREKYKMYKNNPNQEYYIAGEGYNEIWPYGPFGLYFPQQGNHKANGDYWRWYPGSTNTKGNMSGRCMNSGLLSGAAACTDHPLGNLGNAGWRTTLQDMVENGLQGINSGDQFWIADVGAGNYMTKHGNGTPEYSVTGPGQGGTASAHRTPYYEPNGNYAKNAWLNFISDSEGNVYHNDDNNAFYSYYDYMCMAWDNYRQTVRIIPTSGPFTIIEKDPTNMPTAGKLASDLNLKITTKITKREMDLQIVTFDKGYEEPNARVSQEQNISAGVFLSYITKRGNNDKYNELHYFGDIGGDTPSLTINSNGYHDLTASEWPNNKKWVDTAKRKMQIRFKYCQYTPTNWESCWGSGNTCKAGCDPESPTCNCKYASSDFFAVRPKEFELAGLLEDPDLLRSARTYSFTQMKALDDKGNSDQGYDQRGDKLDLDYTVYLATSVPDNANQLHGEASLSKDSNFAFTEGVSTGDINITYDDVAKLKVELYDSDWASIDSGDSPNSCNNETPPYGRRICAEDTNVTFIPDHFKTTGIKMHGHRDGGLGFTYLSNDLAMSVRLDTHIKALNAAENLTQNFRSGAIYYENPVEVNITAPLKDTNGTTLKDLYDTPLTFHTKNISPATLLGFGTNGDSVGTHKTKWDDADPLPHLMFNYKREVDVPINPFIVNGQDLNMSVSSFYVGRDSNATITGNDSGEDIDATFLYARVKATKDFYDDITTASTKNPIMVQLYCSKLPANPTNCPAINTGLAQTGRSNWWLSRNHNQTLNDGNITLKLGTVSSGNPAHANIAPLKVTPTSGIDTSITVTRTANAPLPLTVNIEIDTTANKTNTWMIHNKDGDSTNDTDAPTPFCKDRFIGTSNWAGFGQTGNVVGTKASTKKNHRLGW